MLRGAGAPYPFRARAIVYRAPSSRQLAEEFAERWRRGRVLWRWDDAAVSVAHRCDGSKPDHIVAGLDRPLGLLAPIFFERGQVRLAHFHADHVRRISDPRVA